QDLPAIRRSAPPACEGDFQSYGSSAERVVQNTKRQNLEHSKSERTKNKKSFHIKNL
ncbi:hypothetical protein NPIL_124291, partial [Nephila pilipes]